MISAKVYLKIAKIPTGLRSFPTGLYFKSNGFRFKTNGMRFKLNGMRFKSALLRPRISAKIPVDDSLIAFAWSTYPFWNHHRADFAVADLDGSGADALRCAGAFSDQARIAVLQIAGQSGTG